MSKLIQQHSKSIHRELARGREGLGNQIKKVTEGGKYFLSEAKRHNKILNRKYRR